MDLLLLTKAKVMVAMATTSSMMYIVAIVTVFQVAGYSHGLSYDTTCSETFSEGLGIIKFSGYSEYSCMWNITGYHGDTFTLNSDLFWHAQLVCWDHYLDIKDGGAPIVDYTTAGRLCRLERFLKTKTNKIEIVFLPIDIQFQLYLRISTSRLTYTKHTTPVSWTEAQEVCKEVGGALAEVYPVVTDTLEEMLVPVEQYWIGKSVSPWVWTRGCVYWQNDGQHQPVYSSSKYNQMSECATACPGSLIFLLQEKSCYCFNEEVTRTTTVYAECNTPCPGNKAEMCGGKDTFTQYQNYEDIQNDADGTKNCLAAIAQHQIPHHCDISLGYSCTLINGSVTTFLRAGVLMWQQAIDHCSSLEGSVCLSAVPQFPNFYSGDEALWMAASRGIDWNYPTVTERSPKYGFVATLENDLYAEKLSISSERHGFICQHEKKTCGDNINKDWGTLTSPGFPNKYRFNQLCKWHITVNDSLVLKLSFQNLDTEDSDRCLYDYIEIQQPIKSIQRKRVCGSVLPGAIETKTSSVIITFKSDDSVTGTGFKLIWEAVTPMEDATANANKGRDSPIPGGAVAGISVLVIAILVAIVLLVLGVLYKKRQIRKLLVTSPPPSSVNNAIYGISSFADTDSIFNEECKPYENVSQTRRVDLVIKNQAFENSADLQTVDYENMAGTELPMVFQGRNTKSTSNLIEESSDEEPAATKDKHKQGKRNKKAPKVTNKYKSNIETDENYLVKDRNKSTSDTEGLQANIMTMEEIENIGRDVITVITEGAGDTVAYSSVQPKTGIKVVKKENPFDERNCQSFYEGANGNKFQNANQHPYTNENDRTILNPGYENLEKQISLRSHGKLTSEPSNVYMEFDNDGSTVVQIPRQQLHVQLGHEPSNMYTEIDDIPGHLKLGQEPSHAYAEIGIVNTLKK